MRRSSAPSAIGSTKRARFTVPFAKNVASDEKDENLAVINASNFQSKSYSSKNENGLQKQLFSKKSPLSETRKTLNTVRSTEDVLKLITECDKISPEVENVDERLKNHDDSETFELEEDQNESILTLDEIHNMNSSSHDIRPSEKTLFYSVLWCKRSMKKHKKWEGDAILIIKTRSAILKDLEGKEIARGIGYKIKEVSSLEEGSKFFIGGKECEIQYQVTEDDYNSGKCFQTTSNSSPVKIISKVKKFCSPSNITVPKRPTVKRDMTNNPDAFVMPRPNSIHQWTYNKQQLPVVDVIVDPLLAKNLRPHQKNGIIFLYECILGFRSFSGHGAILADEMGLGKTLQCITLIWILHKQGPYGGRPILKKILIIAPGSLVKNWQKEFYKWLGKERIPVFAVGQNKKVKDFIHSKYAVLIISYEMFVRSAEILSPVTFDLMICDEGHRMKNLNIKTSNVIMSLPISRRILLTGTPIQNDLEEFFSIVQFVNPGILGTLNSFRKIYEEPILHSRNSNSSSEENIVGEARASQLAKLTGLFVLRRTQEIINEYLPPKTEVIVFCRPTDIQTKLYDHLLQSKALRSCLSYGEVSDGTSHLACISALRKLCNHPSLLHTRTKTTSDEELQLNDNSLMSFMQSAYPEDYIHSPQHSGKMKVLEQLLSSLFNAKKKEKIVLVSSFTQTLDIMEDLCKDKNYIFLRLDGSTSTSTRQDLVDTFNSPFSKYVVFLLSSKAGGVGLNLIGASRILLYDIDWNPATDLQALARVWRDGQKHPVYIYRLLTAGTIEEKIYQRQVAKQGLSGTVMDSFANKSQFSLEELKDLFTFHKDVQCVTHDLLRCSCLSPEYKDECEKDSKETVRPCQIDWLKKISEVKNTSMAELFKWHHVPGPIPMTDFADTYLSASGDNITFLFMNKVNFDSAKS